MTLMTFKLLATTTVNVNCPGSNSNGAGATNDTCSTGIPKVGTSGELNNILTIFFGVAAVIAVLMIVIGSIMFVTSGGNPESAAKARQTIIYAVIGLVISILAEVFVNFILGKI